MFLYSVMPFPFSPRVPKDTDSSMKNLSLYFLLSSIMGSMLHTCPVFK